MDVFDSKQCSEIMRRVRSRGTRPELIIRGVIRRMKIKYRSCSPNLPGKPDLVMADQRKVILVHGYHRHRALKACV
jgi:DNA mismatch endonuclease (patch repair protein)